MKQGDIKETEPPRPLFGYSSAKGHSTLSSTLSLLLSREHVHVQPNLKTNQAGIHAPRRRNHEPNSTGWPSTVQHLARRCTAAANQAASRWCEVTKASARQPKERKKSRFQTTQQENRWQSSVHQQHQHVSAPYRMTQNGTVMICDLCGARRIISIGGVRRGEYRKRRG